MRRPQTGRACENAPVSPATPDFRLAAHVSLSSRAMCKTGMLERLSRGLYRLVEFHARRPDFRRSTVPLMPTIMPAKPMPAPPLYVTFHTDDEYYTRTVEPLVASRATPARRAMVIAAGTSSPEPGSATTVDGRHRSAIPAPASSTAVTMRSFLIMGRVRMAAPLPGVRPVAFLRAICGKAFSAVPPAASW